MKSLFIKIFLTFCSVIILSSGTLLFSSLRLIQSHYLKTVIITLETTGHILSSRIVPLLKKKKFYELNKLTKEIEKETAMKVEILDSKGRVIVRGSSLIGSTKRFLFVRIPLDSYGKQIGILRLGMPLTYINPEMDKLVWEMSLLTIGLIGLCLGIAFIFSRTISASANKLAEATQRLARGDFETRLDWKGEDEFSVLAKNFNSMAEKMKVLVAGLVHKQEEVNGIISMLCEGLIVVDKNGKVIACNEAFKDLVGKENLVGNFYKEVITNPQICELIQIGFSKMTNFKKRIRLFGRDFLCSITFLPRQEKVIMTIQDISDVKVSFKMS